jgi:hypothetical protein
VLQGAAKKVQAPVVPAAVATYPVEAAGKK